MIGETTNICAVAKPSGAPPGDGSSAGAAALVGFLLVASYSNTASNTSNTARNNPPNATSNSPPRIGPSTTGSGAQPEQPAQFNPGGSGRYIILRAVTQLAARFFSIRLAETEARPSRWLYGSRKAPRTFRIARSGARAWCARPGPFLTLRPPTQKRKTAACGLATASPTHSESPLNGLSSRDGRITPLASSRCNSDHRICDW